MDFQTTPVRRHKLPRISFSFKGVSRFIRTNRKLLSVIAVAVFLFYWYEVRPITINHTCGNQASTDARALLVSKAKVATDPVRKQSYQQLIDQNMYLRSDYESYYTRCLRGYGINL